MQFRQTDTVAVAAAKASFSTATGHRLAQDPRLPSMKKGVRSRRRPDPLGDLFEAEIVPMLKAAPGLRPIAIYEEIVRRHPELGAGMPMSSSAARASWPSPRVCRTPFGRSAAFLVSIAPTVCRPPSATWMMTRPRT